ncbi:ABC transporter permease [Tropicimonas sp. IMCC34043]|uniref:MlaE family ABC transporter permease n=1 Tax=Tropicimonas sp. IMCC34043 TaxID=2248760 RepID=UPI000E24C040|nr:ABC transporter permease [Tropicimonas sp. IMCC34043]
MPATSTPSHSLTVATEAEALVLAGALTVWTIDKLPAVSDRQTRVELSGVDLLDTAGAWYLACQRQAGAELQGLAEAQARLVDVVAAALPVPEPAPLVAAGLRAFLDRTGRNVVDIFRNLAELAEYVGRFIASIVRALRHPSEFSLTSLVHHCEETGIKALPVVTLMAFLIGIVLAFQGAAQLRSFGAEIFVVDLISISILRELGILLTAIVVAGRTASALTASIGAMKMQEEIDAMRTLGLDPDMVLILPRVLALVLMLPVLGLIADVAGLVGGALMSWVELGISPAMFTTRLVAETSVDNVIVGLSKAPVFAVVIGIIGCRAGMQVQNDAESLGTMTSSSVVQAIFAVIVIDALFSIFFAEVGL